MKTTIEVTNADQATPVEVKHEALTLETVSQGTLREMAKVVFGEIASESNLSDEDLKKYAAAGVNIVELYKKKENALLAQVEERLKTIKSTEAKPDSIESYDAPAPDATGFNYETLQQESDFANDVRVLRNASLAERVSGAPMLAVAKLQSVFEERRTNRLQEKLQGKTAEEQRVFLEADDAKREKRMKAGRWMLAAGLTFWTFKSGIDHTIFPMMFGGGHGGGAATAMDLLTSTDQKGRNYNVDLMDKETPLAPAPDNSHDTNPFQEALLKQYNNSDASFYDFGHKEHRGDFGPGVQASAKDGTMPAGFGDWMARNRHEPNGLANLVSGLKLDGHGDSMTDRNNLANVYDNDKIAQIKADILVQDQLRDPAKFSVETIKIDFPYKTTYMVDANGDPVIAMQGYTDHGGEAFKIINKQTGEATYWRKNCGAYQQIWPLERASQPVYQSTHTSPVRQAVVQQHTSPRPVVPRTSNPVTPTEVIPPSTPDVPVTPTPEVPETPVVPNAKNPLLDINNKQSLSENKKMGEVRMGSGAPQTESEVKAPPATIEMPKPVKDNTDTAPGATPSTAGGLFGNGQQQQSGTSTGAASGNNDGVTKGKVE